MSIRERLIAAMTILVLAAPVMADEAADAFNALYGEEFKRVAATPSTADDLALAKRLLDDAKAVDKQPALLAVLCDKAYDLGMKDPAGYATSLAAMELLAEKVPDSKAGCLQKCAALYQRQYAAARGEAKGKAGESFIQSLLAVAQALAAKDDLDGAAVPLRQALGIATAINSPSKPAVQAELTAQTSRRQQDKQVAALKARLDADPKDAAARKELVRIYLAEKDDPAEAAKFVDDSLDEATRKYVPAAARPIEEVPELACMELAQWYQGLADQDQAATPGGKAAMLGRAKAYYDRFLLLHKTDDIMKAAATLGIKNIDEAIKKLGASAPQPKPSQTAWVDCLKLVDLKRDVVWGKFEQAADGSIVNLQGDANAITRLKIRATPTESYEFEALFVRTGNTDTIAISFPVGSNAVALLMGCYGGKMSGLDGIGGCGIIDSPAKVMPGALVNGKDYLLNVAVLLRGEEAAIAVKMDNKPYVQWKGPASALACNKWRSPTDTGIIIHTQNAAVTLRRLKIRAITGEVKVPPAPVAMETIYKAFRIQDAKVVGGPYAAGDAVKITYSLTNTSGRALGIPLNPQGTYPAVGTLQHWIERQGDDSAIAGVSSRVGRMGRRYAAGGATVGMGPVVEAGESRPYMREIKTADYPPGAYIFYIEFKELGAGAVIQTEKVEFSLTAPK